MARLVLTDDEVRARIGKATTGVRFVLIDDVLFHPVAEGWEAYGDEGEDAPPPPD